MSRGGDTDAEGPILNIGGERVALGPLRDEHFGPISRRNNDYATRRNFTAPGPLRPADTRRSFTEGDFSGPANVVFALYETANRRFIGTAGLFDLDHAFPSLELATVRLGVFSYNPGAVRAYGKAGFKRAGTLRRNKRMGGKLWDTILMDVVAEEFESPVLARVPDEPRWADDAARSDG